MSKSGIILLTGGTGLIGQVLAHELIEAGYGLILTGRDKFRLEAVIDRLRQDSDMAQVTPLVMDLSSAGSANRLEEFLDETSLNPDGLVHCARNLEYFRQDIVGGVSRSDWMGEFNLDVVVPCDFALALVNRDNSRLRTVVIVSSMYGVTPPKMALYDDPSQIPPIHYGVCKAAQLHLARELSVRLAPRGVRVNAVSYGGVRGRVDSAFEKRYAQQCPASRMLDQSDLGGPVLFLLSEKSAATTGHNLLAEGGWTIW